mgnify:CR=1 FL=1
MSYLGQNPVSGTFRSDYFSGNNSATTFPLTYGTGNESSVIVSIFGVVQAATTYSLNNGYITDISVLPYVRSQQVVTTATGMLMNTTVHNFFDGTNVDNYVRKANIIELTNVSGSFSEDDVLGYYTSGIFTPTARVLGVYNYANTTSTYPRRCYGCKR